MSGGRGGQMMGVCGTCGGATASSAGHQPRECVAVLRMKLVHTVHAADGVLRDFGDEYPGRLEPLRKVVADFYESGGDQ